MILCRVSEDIKNKDWFVVLVEIMIVFLAAIPMSFAFAAEISTPPAPTLAITNVNVITMAERETLLRQTVIISGSRISAITPIATANIPDGVEVIDGLGQFLLPGLADMHIHLRHTTEDSLEAYLRMGVTLAREMNGRPHILEWRDRIEMGELSGPQLIVASPTIANFSSPMEGYATPETAEEAANTVQLFVDQGYDFIKVYSFLPAQIFRAIMDKANTMGIPVAGHVPVQISLAEVQDLGLRSIEHLTEFATAVATDEGVALDNADNRGIFHAVPIDEGKLDRLAADLAESGTWNVPTITFFARKLPVSFLRDIWSDPDTREFGLENRKKIVMALHRAGAPMMFGTDTDFDDIPAGTMLWEEFQNLADAGIPNFDILAMATRNPAIYLDQLDNFGTLETGKRADMILVACDPLRSIRCLQYVNQVFKNGSPVLN